MRPRAIDKQCDRSIAIAVSCPWYMETYALIISSSLYWTFHNRNQSKRICLRLWFTTMSDCDISRGILVYDSDQPCLWPWLTTVVNMFCVNGCVYACWRYLNMRWSEHESRRNYDRASRYERLQWKQTRAITKLSTIVIVWLRLRSSNWNPWSLATWRGARSMSLSSDLQSDI